jgi:beta-lactamase regulating signal transducer with metallopeptidase domain
MVLALPRATLLWPANLEDRLDAAARRTVLLHELAHLKRRDHLTAWLEVVVACLWWWHPVVWWARRELRAYAELACDARVVASLPDARSRYAKALVDVCEFISLAKPANAPAVGMARGHRRSFERRLHMILRQRIADRTPLIAWVAIPSLQLWFYRVSVRGKIAIQRRKSPGRRAGLSTVR